MCIAGFQTEKILITKRWRHSTNKLVSLRKIFSDSKKNFLAETVKPEKCSMVDISITKKKAIVLNVRFSSQKENPNEIEESFVGIVHL